MNCWEWKSNYHTALNEFQVASAGRRTENMESFNKLRGDRENVKIWFGLEGKLLQLNIHDLTFSFVYNHSNFYLIIS